MSDTSSRTVKISFVGDAKAFRDTLSQVDSSAQTTEGHLGKLGGAFKSMAEIAGGIFAGEALIGGFEKLKGAIEGSLDAAKEAEQVHAQTQAVLKSTGEAAGVTADQVERLGQAYSTTTTFSKDTVEETENLLLTFTSIGKDIFPQATETALNMAQALGEDTKSAAIQLGKALNDPITGATALRRVGVALTQQQMEQIKAMQQAGNMAGAQAVIMQELQKEFGGSAKAAGTTFAGQLVILHNQLQNTKEELGEALMPVLAELGSRVFPLVNAALGRVVESLPSLEAGAARVAQVLGRLIGDIESHNWAGVGDLIRTGLSRAIAGLSDLGSLGLSLGGKLVGALVNIVRVIDWSQLATSLFYGLGLAFQKLRNVGTALGTDLRVFATYLVQYFSQVVRGINWSDVGGAVLAGLGTALGALKSVGSQALGFGASLLTSIEHEVQSVDWSHIGELVLTGVSEALSKLGVSGSTNISVLQDLVGIKDQLTTLANWLADTAAPAFEDFARRAADAFQTSFLPALRDLAETVWPKVQAGLQFLVDHKSDVIVALVAMGTAMSAYALYTGAVAAATAAVAAAELTLDAIVEASPVGLILTGIAAAAVALYEAWQHDFLGIQEITAQVFDWLKTNVPPAMDAVRSAVDGLVSFVSNLIHGNWSQAWDQLRTTVTNAHDFLVNSALPAIWAGLSSFFTDTLPKIGAQLLAWGQAFIAWVGPVIGPLLLELGKLYLQLSVWMYGTALPAIVEQLGKWGIAFVEWVAPKIVPLLLELGKLELQVAQWMATVALPAIIAKLGEWAAAFIAWVAPLIPPLLQQLGDLLLQLGNWLILTALPAIIKKLGEWAAAFVGWVGPATLDLLKACGDLLLKLGTWIVETAVPDIAGKFADMGKQAGQKLIDSTLGAIEDGWGSITSWLDKHHLGVIADLVPHGGGGTTGAASGANQGPPDMSGNASTGFIKPIDGTFAQGFYGSYSHSKESAVDWAAPRGTPVYAPAAGVIVVVGNGLDGDSGPGFDLQTPDGYDFVTGHMSGFAVSTGQSVSQGQLLGYSGDPAIDGGYGSGAHLHMAIKHNGAYVSGDASQYIPLADGGIVTQPTLAVVGEGGQSEAVIPLDQAGKVIGEAIASSGDGTITTPIPVTITDVSDTAAQKIPLGAGDSATVISGAPRIPLGAGDSAVVLNTDSLATATQAAAANVTQFGQAVQDATKAAVATLSISPALAASTYAGGASGQMFAKGAGPVHGANGTTATGFIGGIAEPAMKLMEWSNWAFSGLDEYSRRQQFVIWDNLEQQFGGRSNGQVIGSAAVQQAELNDAKRQMDILIDRNKVGITEDRYEQAKARVAMGGATPEDYRILGLAGEIDAAHAGDTFDPTTQYAASGRAMAVGGIIKEPMIARGTKSGGTVLIGEKKPEVLIGGDVSEKLLAGAGGAGHGELLAALLTAIQDLARRPQNLLVDGKKFAGYLTQHNYWDTIMSPPFGVGSAGSI